VPILLGPSPSSRLAKAGAVKNAPLPLVAPLLLLTVAASACGLSFGVELAGLDVPDGAPPSVVRPPSPLGSSPPVDSGGGDAAPSVDAASEATTEDPEIEDEDGATATVAVPSVALRFEALSNGRFANDADPALFATPTNAQAQSDAPRGGAAPAMNVGSIRLGANAKAWVKIDPAQALVKTRPTTKLTVAAWVKPETTTGNATIVSFASRHGGTPLFELVRTSASGVRFAMGETAGSNGVAAPTSFLGTGAWRFVAASYDKSANQACFYRGTSQTGGEATLDGCVAYTNREFSPSTTSDSLLVVGNSANENVANPNGNGQYVPSFAGNLDQVFLYLDQVLDLAQIRVLQSKN
jgi:hypothetical protein